MSSAFYEEGSRLLTPGAFEFVLDSELKRAVRSQNFLTLVTLETSREWEGMMVTADDGTLLEVAQVIGREVRDTDLLGHFIPAGTNVVVWPSINHRLPELWTDPERFDPERFSEPRSEHKRHRYAFAPFGGGAHKCIGMAFGKLEIKTVMHRLLSRYRLELPHPGYRPVYDWGGMPVPVDGLPLVLRPL